MTTIRIHFARVLGLLAGISVSLVPVAAFAQSTTVTPNTTGIDTIGAQLLLVVYLIDRYLVPVLFALAFIVFVFGVYRYFIAGAASEEKRQEGQQFVMWSLIGFVIMFSVWGLVNLLVGTFGFGGQTRPALPTFPLDNSTTGAANPAGTSVLNTTTVNPSGTQTSNGSGVIIDTSGAQQGASGNIDDPNSFTVH